MVKWVVSLNHRRLADIKSFHLPGWYVAVTPDNGDHLSPAALRSPIMNQAGVACTLQFYYNMDGEGALR